MKHPTPNDSAGSSQAASPATSAVQAAAVALLASVRSDPRTLRLASRHGHGAGALGGGVGGDGGGSSPPPVPHLAEIEEMVFLARTLMFPGYYDSAVHDESGLEFFVSSTTARLAAHLERQIGGSLRFMCEEDATRHFGPPDAGDDNPWAPWTTRIRRSGVRIENSGHGPTGCAGECADAARRATEMFLARLPQVRRLLSLDVQAAHDGDPAAEHTDEVILCYPGLSAITHHRIAHELYRLGIPLLPRIISEHAHRLTGIDIHPGAIIGERFFIDHGAGTVIGETSRIGAGVKIYQGVTLGAKSFDTDASGNLVRNAKRHPTISDRVTIYAGAVILGGDTIIADDTIVNGGVFITQSVPPGHIVRQKVPELTLRSNPALREGSAASVNAPRGPESAWGWRDIGTGV